MAKRSRTNRFESQKRAVSQPLPIQHAAGDAALTVDCDARELRSYDHREYESRRGEAQPGSRSHPPTPSDSNVAVSSGHEDSPAARSPRIRAAAARNSAARSGLPSAQRFASRSRLPAQGARARRTLEPCSERARKRRPQRVARAAKRQRDSRSVPRYGERLACACSTETELFVREANDQLRLRHLLRRCGVVIGCPVNRPRRLLFRQRLPPHEARIACWIRLGFSLPGCRTHLRAAAELRHEQSLREARPGRHDNIHRFPSRKWLRLREHDGEAKRR